VKYWDDFKAGESIALGSHTITEAEILAFARKYDPQPFHTDPEAARRSIFGGLIASGWHTCAILMRLGVEANQREEAAATGSPGLDSGGHPERAHRGARDLALAEQAHRLRPAPGRGAQPARRGRAGHRRHHHVPPPARRAGSAGMKYFEDVAVGDIMRFGRYEVTKEEIVEYARQFDPQPFHLDEEAAKASLFGGLIASGWHTGAMFIRMVVEHMTPVHATTGAMGFDDLKWIKPVRPGDVLSVESEVKEKVEGRRPDRGTVKIESRIENQRGEVVMSLVSLVIYLRR
jgi:acyl dehydratase